MGGERERERGREREEERKRERERERERSIDSNTYFIIILFMVVQLTYLLATTRIQFLDEAFCISHRTNILRKGMHQTILLSAIGK